METQINLLEVDKSCPSVRMRNKQEIDAFKARIGIWTHSMGVKRATKDFPAWTALLLPTNTVGIKYNHYGKSEEPMELISSSCRILQEAEYLVEGATEREAIRNLCEANKIECPF